MAITYRGVTIPFGKHRDATTDRATKIIAFPAVDGTQEMDMGKRSRPFTIRGLITDMITGSFTKSTLEGWNDGNVGTLNINGLTYSNVRMVRATFGEAYKNAVTGKIACEFSIEFRQLSS